MFVVSFPEIALVSAGVALIFGSLFLPPFYHDILLYGAAALGVFMLVRWFLRRQSRRRDNPRVANKAPPESGGERPSFHRNAIYRLSLRRSGKIEPVTIGSTAVLVAACCGESARLEQQAHGPQLRRQFGHARGL